MIILTEYSISFIDLISNISIKGGGLMEILQYFI